MAEVDAVESEAHSVNEGISEKEREFQKAKSYLLTASSNTGINLYDHLSRVLGKILDERPDNVIDIFEDVSKDAKRTKFTSDVDTVQDKVDRSTEVALAQIQRKLFSSGGDDGQVAVVPEENEDESPLPNIMELCFYFEQANIGLSREEIIRVWLALKKLIENQPVQNARFWGKVFGTEQNYYIAELEYRDGEEEGDDSDDEDEEDKQDEEVVKKDKQENDEEAEVDDTPKPDFKPPVKTPKEDIKTGANKKTYFVCNDPGKPWFKLPQVKPDQICVARQIKKYLTGRLEAPVVSYPPFPGNEANYLRAQIARISAGTHISPLNFYQFDEEGEEEEESVDRENFVENIDFEGVPARELVDPSLANWVHHVQYILPQGRCTWWNPFEKADDAEAEDDEDDEGDQADEPEPETGPPLLTPLSEDENIAGMPAWTPVLSSSLVPKFAVAAMHSNAWPGAHAFAFDKRFENIYVGYGHKYSSKNFSPPPPPPILNEYPIGEELLEDADPTPEEEEALRSAQQEAEASEDVEDEAEGEAEDE